MERYDYDVIVIGAGGAGMRAAIAAAEAGLGRPDLHVAARQGPHGDGRGRRRGGVRQRRHAATAGETHFQDTMSAGKWLNNWRMAELHAKEATDRVRELEEWGAVFDRTKDRKIRSVRSAGTSYKRLVHIGDRTGLELIRTLQDKAVHRTDRRLHGMHDHPPAQGRRSRVRRVRLPARHGRVRHLRGTARWCSRPAAAAAACRSRPTPGRARATGRRSPTRPAPSCWTWSSSSSIRPAWSGRSACAGCSSPRRCAARAASCELRGRAVHGALRPQAHGALHPRRRRALDLHRGEGGRGSPHGGVFLDVRTCRRDTSRASCRACTTSSSNSPAWTSRRRRWRSARPATT